MINGPDTSLWVNLLPGGCWPGSGGWGGGAPSGPSEPWVQALGYLAGNELQGRFGQGVLRSPRLCCVGFESPRPGSPRAWVQTPAPPLALLEDRGHAR